MDDLIAFIDESKKPVRDRATGRTSGKGDFYVVAGAVVFSGDLATMRSRIEEIEEHLGFVLHYQELRSKRRRVEAVKAINEIADWDGYLYETAQPLSQRHHSEHHIRAKTLQIAFPHLNGDGGASRVVLETRSQPMKGFGTLDEKDHQVLQKLRSGHQVDPGFSIDHSGKAEKLLTIADVVAGARSDCLCGVYDEPYALVSHRIKEIHQVFKRA